MNNEATAVKCTLLGLPLPILESLNVNPRAKHAYTTITVFCIKNGAYAHVARKINY